VQVQKYHRGSTFRSPPSGVGRCASGTLLTGLRKCQFPAGHSSFLDGELQGFPLYQDVDRGKNSTPHRPREEGSPNRPLGEPSGVDRGKSTHPIDRGKNCIFRRRPREEPFGGRPGEVPTSEDPLIPEVCLLLVT
jgi:hypothetical protein